MRFSIVSALALALTTAATNEQIRFTNNDAATPVSYASHTLIRTKPKSEAELQLLDEMDVWGRDVDGSLDVLVTELQFQTLKYHELFAEYQVLASGDQIQQQIDQASVAQQKVSTGEWFEAYHRYEEIVSWFQELSVKHSTLMEFIPSIGKSHEGRDIIAVKITSATGDRATKKQIWFQGQIHAREWISGATVQYITNQLLTGYGSSAEITALLDTTEFIIVPCHNPDGFEYTWTHDRLWRKNRRDSQGPSWKAGVDLNRNYDIHWNDNSGASRSPSAETYKGPSAASEPEVQALNKFFLQHTRIVGAIDFHSYSQLLLRPLGYTRQRAVHEADLKRVGDKMRDIIKSVHNKSYDSISSYELYPTSGSAADWFYSDAVAQVFAHHVYAYTIELRPKGMAGAGGFVLPPDQIIPVGEEIFPAVLYFCQSVIEKPLD